MPGPLQHCLVCLGYLGSAMNSQLPELACELLLWEDSNTKAWKPIIMPTYKDMPTYPPIKVIWIYSYITGVVKDNILGRWTCLVVHVGWVSYG